MSAIKNNGKSIMFITEDDLEADAMMAAITKENYAVSCQSGIQECMNKLSAAEIDLLLVNTYNPSLDELSHFARIRLHYSGLLLILTDTIDDTMQVMLYENGIDDILFKPLNMLLLIARIRAMFRRTAQQDLSSLSFGNGLEINKAFRQTKYNGKEISLTSREFDLLWFMAQHAGTTLDRDQLYPAVFGIEYNGYDRAIDMYISRLRNKITCQSDLHKVIKTVRGKGYLFAAQ